MNAIEKEALDRMPFHVPLTVGPFDEADFHTATGARSYLERIRNISAETFMETQQFDTSFFVFHTSMNGAPVVPGVMTVTTLKRTGFNDWGKDMLSKFVADLCRASDAVAVAMVSEVWLNRATSAEDKADQQAWRDAHKGSLKGHRNTTEHLFCSFECARFTEVWAAAIYEKDPIHPGATGRWLGAWQRYDEPGTGFGGRMVGLLKPMAEKEN